MDTETTCHCGGAYGGSDHCPECFCEQYEADCGVRPREVEDDIIHRALGKAFIHVMAQELAAPEPGDLGGMVGHRVRQNVCRGILAHVENTAKLLIREQRV